MLPAFATALALVAATFADAADPVARFSATTVNINPGNGAKSDDLKIDVLRWSTDAERDQLVPAFADEKQFLELLQKQPSVGYIWTSGSVGFAVRYAYRSMLPDGGERVVLVTDRRLDSGGPHSWEALPQGGGKEAPYTVIELRTSKVGGEGKMSLSTPAAIDTDAKTIALANYAAAPVVLKGVKHS